MVLDDESDKEAVMDHIMSVIKTGLTSGIGDSDEDATDIVSSPDETNKLIPWMMHPLWELNRVRNVIW